MVNRGSEWARWDLHIHTKGTAKNDQFGNITFEEYCIELFRKALDKDIKVIGITDYFRVANFKKVIDFQKKIENIATFSVEEKKRISKIFILPNIELRTTPSTNHGSAINFHLLINPSAIAEYEQRFIDNLTFTASSTEIYKLCDYDLAKLGRKKAQDEHLDEEIAIKKGIEQFILNPSDIISAFNRYPAFREHCIVVVSNSNKDGASAFQGHENFLKQQEGSTLKTLRESLYKVSDAIFSPIDKDFFLGKTFEKQKDYLEQFGSYKPCIHGSDAHDLKSLFNPHGERYCWIKAEPSFEGLKQILHEPATRVHIGASRPELKNDYEVIDRIELKNDHVFNQRIYFNQNLTSIIGGRSSGKSTLLQCLAHKLQPNALDNKPPHLDNLCKDLRIIWKDGQEDDTRQIEYFYQGHMYRRSQDEGIEKIVERLLLQKNQALFEPFKAQVAETKLNIAKQLSSYFSIRDQIEQKNNFLHTLGNLNDVHAQIKSLTDQINKFQKDDITDDELKTYEDNKNKLHSLLIEKNELIGLRNNIDLGSIHNFLTIQNPFVFHPSYSLIKDNIEEKIKDIQDYISAKVGEIKKESFHIITERYNNIEIESHRITVDFQFNKVANYLSKSESLKPILKQREQEEEKAANIDKILKEIENLNSEATRLIEAVRHDWLELSKSYTELLKEINSFIVSPDLKITATKTFEIINYQIWIRKNINQQSDKAQSFTNKVVSSEKELLNLFDDLTYHISNNLIKLKQGSTLVSLTKEFFDNSWFKLRYDVTYEGDNYNAMSQGKKAFVVLKMTLDCSDSKCPIIIDQPEDDLDNRAIYTELVTYLKEKKTQRQIILVTHNANVVVNADSELVIVANQHGSQSPNNEEKKFQYKYGSIECLTKSNNPNASILERKRIKEHICEILEGGHQAFKLRERKYDMS
ncbi:TrlF family AAA-like ATPase [Acinetobacter baumannii]|uniref:TrlF family AAA-like ATPase n=1 Tax=Acinetobacter baumannii TaxID=470 RepID=UPI0005F91974|nr:hypothetical protein [Acinetobacter baumannii]KJX71037.1 hypothetical protein WH42_18650 [Acinetobacter baumannii]MCO9030639.1 hypothetical protein [Acinetobacter baumannii]MCO9033996.1 hypothetical protein [Acinetobacter baumannii]MCO9039034.1 hypothetical protein [Acinetobacter baumannii]MCO9043717.1 hypothetical protein [Acinetobacter baumannii]